MSPLSPSRISLDCPAKFSAFVCWKNVLNWLELAHVLDGMLAGIGFLIYSNLKCLSSQYSFHYSYHVCCHVCWKSASPWLEKLLENSWGPLAFIIYSAKTSSVGKNYFKAQL